MISKHLVAFVVALSFTFRLGAAPGNEDAKKDKVRHVWPMLVAPTYIPQFALNKVHMLAPVDAPDYESPPANLAVKKSGKGDAERLPLSLNYIGPAVEVRSSRFELGYLAPKTGPDGKPAASKAGSKESGEFKPFVVAELPGENVALCFFPKQRNDWRAVSGIAMSLDGVKAADNRVLVFNVATAPVTLRLSGDRPVTVAVGTGIFVPWAKNAEGMMPLQVAALRSGKQEIIANTAIDPLPAVPVFVFVDADPKEAGKTVTFHRGSMDPDAVKASDKPASTTR